MKYILAITTEYSDIYIEYFDTKEALLAFFEKPFFETRWELIDTVDWNHLEKYTNFEPEYVARDNNRDGIWTEAHLRVIE